MATKSPTPERAALEKIAEWAKAEPGVELGDGGTIVVDGVPPLTIEVTADSERSQLIYTQREPGAAADRVAAVRGALPQRGGGVRSTVATDDTGLTAILVSTLYHDGLSRQAFASSFSELIALADRIATPPAPVATTPAAPVGLPAAVADEPLTTVLPAQEQPMAAPVDDTAPTMAMPAVWAPTHQVPAGGMKSWPRPDPASEPVVDLEARVELAVAERKGDWARVIGVNGWTGWVDARHLQPIGTAKPARTAGGFSASSPLALLGAVAVAVSVFLPWFGLEGVDANAFDFPMALLWDAGGSGNPALGYLVVALGVLGLAALVVPQVAEVWRRVAGVAALGVAGVFVFRVYQALGEDVGTTVDAVGYGVYAAIAGAVLLAVAPGGRRSPT